MIILCLIFSVLALIMTLYNSSVLVKIDKDLQETKKELYGLSDDCEDFYENEFIPLYDDVEKSLERSE